MRHAQTKYYILSDRVRRMILLSGWFWWWLCRQCKALVMNVEFYTESSSQSCLAGWFCNRIENFKPSLSSVKSSRRHFKLTTNPRWPGMVVSLQRFPWRYFGRDPLVTRGQLVFLAGILIWFQRLITATLISIHVTTSRSLKMCFLLFRLSPLQQLHPCWGKSVKDDKNANRFRVKKEYFLNFPISAEYRNIWYMIIICNNVLFCNTCFILHLFCDFTLLSYCIGYIYQTYFFDIQS